MLFAVSSSTAAVGVEFESNPDKEEDMHLDDDEDDNDEEDEEQDDMEIYEHENASQ